MTHLEWIDKCEGLEQRLKKMVEDAKVESRKLSATEDTLFNALSKELSELRANEPQKPIDINVNLNNKKMDKKEFRLLDAINESLSGRLSDETMAVNQAGRDALKRSGFSPAGNIIIPCEDRGITVANTSGVTVEVDKVNVLEPLRDKLVMVQAGATYLTGLVGDVEIPAYSGSSVGWATEVAAASDAAGSFSKVALKPKRLTAILDVSKQFLAQDSVAAEAMLREDLNKAVAEKLEQTIFGSHAKASDKPDGFFTVVPTDKGAVTYDRIVNMEANMEAANVSGEMKYIMHPKVKAKCKTTVKAANQGFIWENGNTVNGCEVLSSNAVAKGLQTGADEFGVVFGNFSEYVIAQWGSLDLTVDTFTKASEGQVRLVINAYFDAKPRRAGVFAIASMK